MIKYTTIAHSPQTIVWNNDRLVDWTFAGKVYSKKEDLNEKIGKYAYRYDFDSAVSSDNGEYICLYQRLGTKGIILKNGDLIREINRSYYHADVYEYPVTFTTLFNGKTILIHCPQNYCQLDFEDVETGEILTDQSREPMDFFHSRLEVSPNNKYLLSKGWGWQPFDYIASYDIEKCLKEPQLLDNISFQKPVSNGDINTASFIDDRTILIGTSPEIEPFDKDDKVLLNPGQIGIWNIETNEVDAIKHVNGDFGNLFVINKDYAWDMYKYPKIINLNTGNIEDSLEDIESSRQCSSIIHHLPNCPVITFNRKTKAIALKTESLIEIFEFEI